MSRSTFVKYEIAFLLAIPIWALVSGCAGLGPDSFTTVYLIAYYYLVTGWALFLSRVLPNVVVDWLSLGIAGASLIGLICGMHFFFAVGCIEKSQENGHCINLGRMTNCLRCPSGNSGLRWASSGLWC